MKDKPKIKNDSWGADLANALMLRPVFRKPKEPEKPKEDFYGGDGTWHQTGHVDVQLNKKGEVVAVWFRCRMLPFQESREFTADDEPVQGEGSIKGIVFEDE